jgi:hypothetical protein
MATDDPAKSSDVVSEKAVAPAPAKKGFRWWYCCIIAVIGLILLLILYFGLAFVLNKLNGGSWSWKSTSKSTSKATGDLKVASPKLEEGSAKSATFSAAGGVMSVRGADGTLYTLTVPPEALILPSTVTMTPLSGLPLSGIDKATAGNGVSLAGEFSFIRPAYLTIQPNTEKLGKKATANYCSIGSALYDPEICAGLAKIPFGLGVAPGQILAGVHPDRSNQILLEPTVFTGMKNTTNGIIYWPGSYFAAKVDKDTVDKFAQMTLHNGADIVNQGETYIHLAALGGSLEPYKAEIARFKRAKDDYPREVLKDAMVALAVGDKEIATTRTNAYKETIARKSTDIRGTFIPWIRYAAITMQVDAQAALKGKKLTSGGTRVAYASEAQLQDWGAVRNRNDGGDQSSNPPLRNYEGDNGVNYGDDRGSSSSWSDIWNNLFPPDNPEPDPGNGGGDNIQDWGDIAANDAAEQNADDDIANGCWDTLAKEYASMCEKADAVRTLIALGRVNKDTQPIFADILAACAAQCATLAECEGLGDIGDQWGNQDIINAVQKRMIDILQDAETCDIVKKKGLADYGQNSCKTIEDY